MARPVRELLDTLIALSDTPVQVQIDPDRLRPSDVPVSVCDNHRLVEGTGWQQRYSLQDTLRDLLDWWRKEIAEKQGNIVHHSF
ncbi:hypothetical protein KFU94_54325 [Chloroflexi bacterium TSY]|nr:hypothetical protein [Chloroflexi bacterium TSY]